LFSSGDSLWTDECWLRYNALPAQVEQSIALANVIEAVRGNPAAVLMPMGEPMLGNDAGRKAGMAALVSVS
jgi:hypothetical protein